MDAAGTSSSEGTEDHVEQPHVLVVDNCVDSRVHNEKMFEKCSCKVTTAESGSKALKFLRLAGGKQRPGDDNIPKVNMISTNYNMPGMNGYKLLKNIKQSSTMKDVPVVIVSSVNDPILIDKCQRAGALMFISKPLKPSDLEELMTLM